MPIVLLRRNNRNNVKDEPLVKVYKTCSIFRFSYKATDILNIKNGDGLEFYMDMDNNVMYLEKSNHKMSYKLNRPDKSYVLRFSNAKLRRNLLECYGLDDDKKHVFLLVKNGKKYQLEYKP